MKNVLRFVTSKAKLLLAVALVAAVSGGTVGAVMASIPDASGVIHACYRTSNGSIRIIDDTTQTCSGNETALNWSQTGPQGPPGTPGAPGSGKTLKVIIEGQEFGPVVDAHNNTGSVTFFYEPFERFVSLDAPNANLPNRVVVGMNLGRIVYLTNDCTGTAYSFAGSLNFQGKNFLYNNVMSLGYDKHFIIDYNEPTTTITPASELVFDAEADTVTCGPNADGTIDVLELTPVTMPINEVITDPLRFIYE